MIIAARKCEALLRADPCDAAWVSRNDYSGTGHRDRLRRDSVTVRSRDLRYSGRCEICTVIVVGDARKDVRAYNRKGQAARVSPPHDLTLSNPSGPQLAAGGSQRTRNPARLRASAGPP
jgi:hypothetical protein